MFYVVAEQDGRSGPTPLLCILFVFISIGFGCERKSKGLHHQHQASIVVVIAVVRERSLVFARSLGEVDQNLKSEFVFDDDDVNSKLKTF